MNYAVINCHVITRAHTTHDKLHQQTCTSVNSLSRVTKPYQ